MATDIGVSDFDFEQGRMEQLASQQAWAQDASLHVRFEKHAELDSYQTFKQGRKIFREEVYVRILMPANRLNEIFRKVTDEDRARFPRQFRAFLDNAEVLQIGTPLREIPNISAAQVLELKHLKVDTVEQLAGMADTTAQLLGTGGVDLKQRAIKFLDRTANSEELSLEVRDLRGKLEALIAEMAQQKVEGASIVVTEHKA